LICGLLSGAMGVISALAFLKGSEAMPWDIQTWDGESDKEKAFQSAAKRWNRVGLAALGIAFILSAAGSVAAYYS
jgi:hypothetical protein